MDMFCFVKYGERYSVFQKLFSCVMQLESPKTLESFCFLRLQEVWLTTTTKL